jgi:hypothetical protein
MSDRVYARAVAALCTAAHDGRAWRRAEAPLIRPSTGLMAVVLAMHACANVSLFGLRTAADACLPHHYFDAPGVACTRDVPEKYDHAFHDFELEHSVYAAWSSVSGGRLAVY